MEFSMPKDRFYFIAFLLFIMWVGFMSFLYLKADEITRDPCSICAEKIQETITCTTQAGGVFFERKYFPDSTIVEGGA